MNEGSIIEYSQKVVFFIDILGFKSLIQGTKDKLPITPKYIKTLLDIINDYATSSTGPSKIVTQFSDSVVISFNYNDPAQLYETLLDLSCIQTRLLAHGLFIRGGCALGEVYHDEKALFGPAVNIAYELESKCAVYPRVILSEDIIDACVPFSTNPTHTTDVHRFLLKRLLCQDTDGYYYIDYISFPWFLKKDFTDKALVQGWLENKKTLKFHIENGLNNKDVSIKQKYFWLKEKFNKSFTSEVVNFYKTEMDLDVNIEEVIIK